MINVSTGNLFEHMGILGRRIMNHSLHTLFIILFMKITVISVVLCQKRNVIKLENGGYSNVLIAIQSDVAEDQTIIDNLKAMYTAASERLYHASRQHVYWKDIKILVPNTWSRQSQYGVATTETEQTSNILVHNHNNARGDEPYVFNPDGCGKEGVIMHITPRYVMDEQYREYKYGLTDNVLVRTWGYLRWGLFEEHYDEAFRSSDIQPAYDVPGGIEGTRCSLKICGNIVARDGSRCRKGSNDVNYPEGCRFIPDNIGQTATASLLFGTSDVHIHTLEEFCDNDPSNPDGYHNAMAPNPMNKHCRGDSAWTVMKDKTGDFVNGSWVVTSTVPSFSVIQAPPLRSVVLVLDISGSMSGSNRFVKMIQSCTEYIKNIIPVDSQLGIVVFHTFASVNANLTTITDASSRNRLVALLPTGTTGSTSIGSGILKGIEVLGSYSAGGYISLLSDGAENANPYIQDTYTAIDNAGVIIDTFSLSNQADPQLIGLSDKTEGLPTFCPDSDSGTCLIQAFQTTITQRPSVGSETVSVQIYSSNVVILYSPGYTVVPVIIDSALGNNTVFTVTWTSNILVTVVVNGPDGTRVDDSDTRYNVDASTKIISVTLPTAESGLWNVTIYSSLGSTDYASVAVTSKPSTDDFKPVTVRVILGSQTINYAQTPALAIYAQVQQDYRPVVEADVEAIITDSYGSTSTIPLLDNGSGSDLSKGDGTYSGFFLDFSTNGRYNVKVNVLGYEVIDGDFAANGRRGRRSVQTVNSAPSFMRTASGGLFEVESYTTNAPDTLAPSRIQDLTYTSFSYDNSTVTLTWTAVGDDLDHGTAHHYELRYSTNFSMIRNDFDNAPLVTQDQIVDGNLSRIASAGTIETITIELPERGDDIVYYFSNRAWDEAGNGGDKSNIASLSIRYIPLAVTATDQTMVQTNIVTEVTTTELATTLFTGSVPQLTTTIPDTSSPADIITTTAGPSLTTRSHYTVTPSDVLTETLTSLSGTTRSLSHQYTTTPENKDEATSTTVVADILTTTTGLSLTALSDSTVTPLDVFTETLTSLSGTTRSLSHQYTTTPDTEDEATSTTVVADILTTTTGLSLTTLSDSTVTPLNVFTETLTSLSGTTRSSSQQYTTTPDNEEEATSTTVVTEVPTSTPAVTEEPGPENLALIIGVSCAVGAIILGGALGAAYFFHAKKRSSSVHPTDYPQKSKSDSGMGMVDVEESQNKTPAHMNPAYTEA